MVCALVALRQPTFAGKQFPDPNPPVTEVARPAFRHLRPAGVTGAQKENFYWICDGSGALRRG
jgi:hypothetical protein